MKKLNKFGISALLAASAMIFGLASCDTGNKEYNDEIPTTYNLLNESGNDASMTAKWDFTTMVAAAGTGDWAEITTAEAVVKGEIKPSEGEGATLVPGGKNGFKGKSGNPTNISTRAGALQSGANTCSLSDLGNSYSLILTLDKQSNIVIKGAGSGPADPKRLLALYTCDEDGAPTGEDAIVSKGSLNSSKEIELGVVGAPAGTYLIYTNGAFIFEIDCRADATVTKPAAVSGLTIYNSDSEKTDYTKQSLEAVLGEYQLSLFDDADTSKANDLKDDAVWSSSNNAVATVKAGKITAVAPGTVKIRARIGLKYDEVEVEVTKLVHFIINGEKYAAGAEIVLGTRDSENFVIQPAGATVTIGDTTLASYANGKITSGAASGTSTITISHADVTADATVNLIVIGELEDVDSWDFVSEEYQENGKEIEAPIAGKENVLSITKVASAHANAFKVKEVVDSTSAHIDWGVNFRAGTAADGCGEITLPGDSLYAITVKVYNNAGSEKSMGFIRGTNSQELVPGDATKGIMELTFYAKGKFNFCGQGTDGFSFQKITVKKEKVNVQ